MVDNMFSKLENKMVSFRGKLRSLNHECGALAERSEHQKKVLEDLKRKMEELKSVVDAEVDSTKRDIISKTDIVTSQYQCSQNDEVSIKQTFSKIDDALLDEKKNFNGFRNDLQDLTQNTLKSGSAYIEKMKSLIKQYNDEHNNLQRIANSLDEDMKQVVSEYKDFINLKKMKLDEIKDLENNVAEALMKENCLKEKLQELSIKYSENISNIKQHISDLKNEVESMNGLENQIEEAIASKEEVLKTKKELIDLSQQKKSEIISVETQIDEAKSKKLALNEQIELVKKEVSCSMITKYGIERDLLCAVENESASKADYVKACENQSEVQMVKNSCSSLEEAIKKLKLQCFEKVEESSALLHSVEGFECAINSVEKDIQEISERKERENDISHLEDFESALEDLDERFSELVQYNTGDITTLKRTLATITDEIDKFKTYTKGQFEALVDSYEKQIKILNNDMAEYEKSVWQQIQRKEHKVERNRKLIPKISKNISYLTEEINDGLGTLKTGISEAMTYIKDLLTIYSNLYSMKNKKNCNKYSVLHLISSLEEYLNEPITNMCNVVDVPFDRSRPSPTIYKKVFKMFHERYLDIINEEGSVELIEKSQKLQLLSTALFNKKKSMDSMNNSIASNSAKV